MTTTIVTMFFNLKKLKDQTSSTRPIEFYIENAVHILKLKYPMVIFCDEDTKDLLKEMRDKQVGNSAPTEYIVKNLSDYDYYKHNWEIIRKNREQIFTNFDNRNTPSYFLMGMFKPLALWIARQKNFFNTKYYAWMDIGCNHIVKELDKYAPIMLNNPKDKITVCYIHYRSHDELKDMKEYMKHGGPCAIASTVYTVEDIYVEKFYCLMFTIFFEKILIGVGHTDETVMAYCYDRVPSIFNLYYGDYQSTVANYHEPVMDLINIYAFLITNALKKRRIDLAKDASKKILDSVEKNFIQFPLINNLKRILNEF